MGHLRINKVIYQGAKYTFESPDFDNDIILIEGWNGTGKSTFCNLIYFGLGGDVDSFRKDGKEVHSEIVYDTDNYVDLFIDLSGENFLVRRYFGDTDVTIIPYELKSRQASDGNASSEDLQEIEVEPEEGEYENDSRVIVNAKSTLNLPINRRGDCRTYSDWLLQGLKISVVELYQGYSTFKIGFSDLMRLMYHDQQPDPEGIYKKIDKNKSEYVSDSEVLRKAIFELLVGKSYSDYYDAIVEEKRLAKDKSVAKSLVGEYSSIADKMRKGDDLKNVAFLQSEIQGKEAQLEKLHSARNAFKLNRSSKDSVGADVAHIKDEMIESELGLSDAREKYLNLLDERYKFSSVQEETATDIQRIQKVIFSHDQLNLFTADTCPYCLGKVERVADHCVCGASIDEEQYERFFYTSHEYKEILKSKLKTLSTIDMAIQSCSREISELKIKISGLERYLNSLRRTLSGLVERSDSPVDIESLNDIDDKILNVREDINQLYQWLEIETKLKTLQDKYELISDRAKEAELLRKELEVKAQRDIAEKVGDFSRIYNDLVTRTLPSCRSAKIRLEDYMPSIDDGIYREMSSRVSVRLMYYIALMKLSLEQDDISFPRFLLIDTPETAGIELENLKNCLNELSYLTKFQKSFQVIITTGIDKYPETLKENRVIHMRRKTKEEMLLKERPR